MLPAQGLSGAAFGNLARLWRESGDTGVPGRVAEKVGVSVGEVEELLRKMLGDGDGGQDKE